MTPAPVTAWDESATSWVAHRERYDALAREFERALLERAALQPGERVLDVGCGTGTTTLDAAAAVGPTGSVVGVDASSVMLEHATQRASEVDHVFFEHGDAETRAFGTGHFDVVVSRFALMLFEHPVRGLANLRRALRPGGRIVATVWQERSRNAWMTLPPASIAAFVDLPAGGYHTGPFSLADPDRITALLDRAGFESIEIVGVESEPALGQTPEDVLAFFGADMGARMRAVLAPAAIEAVEESLGRRLEAYACRDGVRIPCAAWVFSARRS